MDLAFANNRLRRQMSSEREMQRAFGDRAKRLQLRLRVLKNTPSLADVPRDPPTRCHELIGEGAGCFAVMITGNWRLGPDTIHFLPDFSTLILPPAVQTLSVPEPLTPHTDGESAPIDFAAAPNFQDENRGRTFNPIDDAVVSNP